MTISRERFLAAVEASQQFTPQYADDVLVRIAHHSAAIEGNTLTLADTISLLVDERIPTAGKPMRELYEVANHREALASTIGSAFSGTPLTSAFIRQLHGELMDHIHEDRGQWRKTQNAILGSGIETVAPAEVPWLMEQWAENASWQADNLRGRDALSAIADAHIAFEQIHPFADGNGRTARMLIMWQALRTLGTPLIIEVDQRSQYIDALKTENRNALTALFGQQYLRERERQKRFS